MTTNNPDSTNNDAQPASKPSAAKPARVITKQDDAEAMMKQVLDGQGKGVKRAARTFGSTAAQKAAGRKNPKERLVRHGPNKPERSTLKAFLRAIWRIVVATLPYAAPIIAYLIWGEDDEVFAGYILRHLGLVLFPILPIAASLTYTTRNYMRTHPSQQKGKPRKLPLPALPGTSQHGRDINDIIANLDHLPLRIVYLGLLAGAIYVSGHMFPLDTTMFIDLVDDPEGMLRSVLIPLVAPVVAFAVPRLRTSFIISQRREEIADCYTIAASTLGYKTNPPKNATTAQIREATPWLAVDVKKWDALYEIGRAFILAPETLLVSKLDVWDSFTENMNTKMPRPEEWRSRRDERGRGATIGPANYPTAVLWDGDIDDDPLTYWIGINLETGARTYLTLGEVSPHAAISGGTASGKTSLAEIIAAQAAIKSMPWDPSLHGLVVLVDPKGPLTNRWLGRPGVIAANGNIPGDIQDDDGNYPLGEEVMADLMRWLVSEQKRREAVLHRFPDAGTWVALPDHVKRSEQFYPIIVILDEFLEHTAKASGDDEETVRASTAHEFIASTATKQAQRYRNVGMHSLMIAQRANMTEIGSRYMTNLPVRCVTGQMDPTQLRTMFGTDTYPGLPSTRIVIKNGERKEKTIPGRARFMNAGGQEIIKIQIPYFGGDANSDTLNKWLPRGEKPINGDFSLPTNQPRRPEDFDANGDFIGDPDPTPTPASDGPDVSSPEQEMDAADSRPGSDHDPAPSVTLPSLTSEDFEDDPHEWDGAGDEEPDHTVFPAAETPRCAVSGCVNDAAGGCPQCGEPSCRTHIGLDPSGAGPMCETCQHRHAVYSTEEFGQVWDSMSALVTAGGQGLTLGLSHPEGAAEAVATISVPAGKLIAVTFDTELLEVSSRSRSGSNEGGEDVIGHIHEVVDRHVHDATGAL